MFKIHTTATPAKVLAYTRVDGKRRQVTVPADSMAGLDSRHGAAAGVLLSRVLTPLQVSKLMHPSGAQRVRQDVTDAAHMTFTVNV